MTYAQIIGWGSCLPPARLTNHDITTVMETSEQWITERTGIKTRRISHVKNVELAHVASVRALACANVSAKDIDVIAYATTTADEVVPNTASMLQRSMGATNAACFDLNAACTGFLYSFNMMSDMIRSGSVKTVLVVGSERLSSLMNWSRRDSAILFGDGAGAMVLQASAQESGFIQGKLGCIEDTRELLAIPDFGLDAIAQHRPLDITIDFHGKEIFKNAVTGMARACTDVLEQSGLGLEDVDLIIPHQANLRIIEALVKRLGADMDKVVVTLDHYANTSTSSIPIALCEALGQGRVKPGMTILMAAFGAGLTWGATLVKWGERITPLGSTDVDLPPTDKTGLELIQEAIAIRASAADRF
ncbi:MAG: ketoacyl-ACP synthase III [Porticoccaceae bacterium]|nr:ketoacyl-ACP synthase III [Porticoccaceae bacterium]